MYFLQSVVLLTRIDGMDHHLFIRYHTNNLTQCLSIGVLTSFGASMNFHDTIGFAMVIVFYCVIIAFRC